MASFCQSCRKMSEKRKYAKKMEVNVMSRDISRDDL